MSDAVIAAAQARLAAAFPDWVDATDDPNPTPDGKLPSFAVAVSYSASEPLGMGDPRYIREGQLEVAIRTSASADNFTGEGGVHTDAKALEAAILADPPYLDGTLWELTPEGFDADHEPGGNRISQGDLIFAIQTIE